MKKYVVCVKKFDLFADNKEHTSIYGYIVETDDILHIVGEIYYSTIEQIYGITFGDYYEGIEKEHPKIIFIPYKQKYPIGWNGFGKEKK